jgi:aminopeptidase N
MFAFLRICCLIAFGFTAAFLRAEEPFSFENTPGKLPKDIVPIRYAIDLAPDLDQATFFGEEVIEVEVAHPTQKIVLNSLGLEITRGTLVLASGALTLPAPQMDAGEQTATFSLKAALAPGRCTIRLAFSGKLTEAPEGLYISRFQKDGKDRHALATQFEATDARRMFPCWDEPVFKATFSLGVTAPKRFQVVSNMPASEPQPVLGDLVKYHFAESPKMSTYLLALCIGDFEKIEDEIDGIHLRIFVTPGKLEQARFAMEATKKVVHFYNDYFGVKYPLPKLDQVALPSTGAGGMENWGCIVFNDNALLYDPATSSEQTKERVFAVVAHEIAHQWFGDLVTMAWWDNLWLNEGFASWMGTKATDHFNPEWKVWLRASGDKNWAMRLDSRATTHPIQQRIANESQAIDSFDEITYSKGQSVLRMIESWLGEEPFRDGIRGYMKAHAYSSSTTADLWRALEDSSGKPVRELAAGWTEQPGFPVVRVGMQTEQPDTTISLSQERFTIHQADAAPLLWQIPVVVGPAGDPLHGAVLLLKGKAAEKVVFDPEIAIKANLGDRGYFRSQYSEPLFKRLRKAVPHLAEVDRVNLLFDTWALVEAGRTPAADYLNLADAIADDPTPTELGEIIGVLESIDRMERDTGNQTGFRSWAIRFLQPHLAKLGWNAKPGETPLKTNLRASLIRVLGLFGDPATIREARARFIEYLQSPASLDGNLRGPVFLTVGRNADEATWEKLHSLARNADSFEQKRALYSALTTVRDPALASKALALSLTNELIAPDAARIVGRVSYDGEHPELAWDFAREHLDALLEKLPALGVNDYVPGIFRGFTDAARADELEAFAQKNLPPAVHHSVAKSADEIRFEAEFKQRALPEIDAWWKEKK